MNLSQPPIPSEEPFTVPEGVDIRSSSWTVIALNRRVNHDWNRLIRKAPENAARCYEHLCQKPLLRWPGRIYPLKGKKYRGVWAYEITSGDRVYYIPNPEKQRVVVYYAGSHPKAISEPPRSKAFLEYPEQHTPVKIHETMNSVITEFEPESEEFLLAAASRILERVDW